ncbi:MAG TPA: TonB-dependent receptor plug domain-containing protein [Sphingomonas sp.]|nr:TonB-dependent receptor plug domain-containing protein [Sphingomonas sp.]
MKTRLTYLLLTTVLAAGVALPAAAQDTTTPTGDPVADAKIANDEDKPQSVAGRAGDVIVTGTRIVRPNLKSAAPITTVTAAEILEQGATTIEEVLNRLPQVAPNAEQNYADSEGRQRIKLRSLGFERTLTLVDGMRLGIQNGQDVGIIPNALVERVDVLSGGASSVYGSDAVSGVVNFILKKDLNGIRLDAGYGIYNHYNKDNVVNGAARRTGFPAPVGWVNDGARANIALSAGKNLFDNRLNITGFVNYRSSDVVPIESRSTSSCSLLTPAADGTLSCFTSTYTQSGFILPTSGPRTGQALVNDPNGAARFVSYNSGPNTVTNPFSDYAYQRQFRRWNAGGFLNFRISNAAEVFGTLLYYNDKSENPLPQRIISYTAYGSTPFRTNCANPYLSAAQAADLCGAEAGNATSFANFDLRYRLDGLPQEANRFENRGTRATLGVRGQISEALRYELQGVYASNRSILTRGAFPDFTKVQRSLDVVNVNGVPTCRSRADGTDPACVPFNAFRAFAATNVDFLNYVAGPSNGQGNSIPVMFQVVGTVSADLGKYGLTSPFATQGLAIAVGGEYRDEKFVNSGDAGYFALVGGSNSRLRRNIWEGNIEANVPLVEDQDWTKLLQMNLGYRKSKYNQLVGSFDTWKVEGIWSPVRDVTFRGSINKAQAAPTLSQATNANDVFFTRIGAPQDPCSLAGARQEATLEACRRTGLPDNLYRSATLNCPDGACTIRSGEFGLAPETAYTKTFGVVLTPSFIKGLTISADRYLIDLKDQITYFDANGTLNECLLTGDPYWCQYVVRDPVTFTLSAPANAATPPTAGFIRQGTGNGYRSQSHGWDFQAQYSLGLGKFGKIDWSFNGSLTTRQGSQGAPTIPARDCKGLYGPGCGEGIPKWTHGLRTTYSPMQGTSLSLNWRYIDPMTITFNAPASAGIGYAASARRSIYNRLDAYNYFDLALTIEVAKQFTFRITANNLLDKDPPLIPDARGLLGLLQTNSVFRYDLLGRQVIAGASLRF